MTNLHRAVLTAVCCACAVPAARADDDGRRAVDVKRFGVTVRVPQAWRLISWARDDQAFLLRIPQDGAASRGFVKCELAPAPAKLADCQQREQTEPPADAPPMAKRRLVECRLEPLDAARYGEKLAKDVRERLESVWEIDEAGGQRDFEMRTLLVSHGTLYTFTMLTDEAHYEAYRLDFDDMLASARFSPPEIGLERMPGGMWMQRDFKFALRLPGGWKPAFGPTDKALLYATAPAKEGFIDSVVVQAMPSKPLELERLKVDVPADYRQADERARASSEIVPQGALFALETRVSTWQGTTTPITILERRFRTATRNYVIRFTCETSRFDQLHDEFIKAFESFTEVVETKRQADA